MLIKSVKHDIMATYRDFVGIYVALLLAALIGPFILQTGNDIVDAIAIMILFGIVFSMVIITFLAIIRLYNRRLFSNEGYLTLTLPVKTEITIISKVITGLIWSILTSLVFIVAGLIFFGIELLLVNVFNFSDMAFMVDLFNEIVNVFSQWEVIRVLLTQLPLTLVTTTKDLVLLVFIMTFINTSFIKKGKLPIGVAAYMILGGIISGISSTIFTLVLGEQYIANPSGTVILNQIGFVSDVTWLSFSLEMGVSLVFIALLGYASWWLLEHKLEIE